ncbi:MAG: ATP-grasp domain-containing protein [Planctomycetota bacterium]|nr:ATP-grasp domain-containing protein [Planctomycetota bacterium]
MNVLMISPGYPAEMPHFTRGLAEVGARVYGVGDQAREALTPELKKSMHAYLAVQHLWDEDATAQKIKEWCKGQSIDRVECLWEPGMILAAKVRASLGVPGMTVAQTVPFRDKVEMKRVLEGAGVRMPRHARVRSQKECWDAAERFGYPLIIKPVSGAGSADTYPAREAAELEAALKKMGHLTEATVEEFVEGEEHTFDTVCANGKILFENIAWYRPTPLVAKLNEWVSAQSTCLRDIERPDIAIGRDLGRKVLTALGFQSGFTHMEWFRNKKGEAVFGEIGARPPGARLVHLMNYACDVDLFRGWAEAVCWGKLSQDVSKKYNCGVIFKRAVGQGRIQRYEGLDRLLERYGDAVKVVDLNAIGSPRRDWKNSAIGDGWIVVRHADREIALAMGDAFASEFCIVAG